MTLSFEREKRGEKKYHIPKCIKKIKKQETRWEVFLRKRKRKEGLEEAMAIRIFLLEKRDGNKGKWVSYTEIKNHFCEKFQKSEQRFDQLLKDMLIHHIIIKKPGVDSNKKDQSFYRFSYYSFLPVVDDETIVKEYAQRESTYASLEIENARLQLFLKAALTDIKENGSVDKFLHTLQLLQDSEYGPGAILSGPTIWRYLYTWYPISASLDVTLDVMK
ncbi:MAG: hypothetical protein PHF57_12470 [Methanoregula sp.]|jgi:hypothetical protein|nr:hypothetical protein [Methanoregula sp.]